MTRERILISALLVCAGLVVGYLLTGLFTKDQRADGAATGERKILYWVAPMDPNYRRDAPGKSPMGMDLVPVYEGEEDSAGAQGSSVLIDASVVNNIGVRTAQVEEMSLRPPIQTVGRIMFDEERVAHIHIRSDGWIERLAVRAEGEAVAEGDLLFEVYSPDLVNAQAEFLQALRSNRSDLIDASHERLRALDIAESQITELETAKKPFQYIKVFAPIGGVVTSLSVADGQFVKPDTDIMALADLSVVWLVSDVFESNAGLLREGAMVKAQSKFEPGEVIAGRVDYIYPDLDPVMRTVPVRTELENPGEKLKPGMFMTVEIEGPSRPKTAVIPREALIRTGRQERVIVVLEEGRFQPAAVVSGMEAGGKVEILSGLAPGETVVASGQFLIDSESSFAGASLRFQPPKSEPEEPAMNLDHGHDHKSMAPSAGQQAKEMAELFEGRGVIKEIKAADRTVTLSHDPIPELGWPAMTMDLPVMESVDLTSVNADVEIQFYLSKSDSGRYAIHSMEVVR